MSLMIHILRKPQRKYVSLGIKRMHLTGKKYLSTRYFLHYRLLLTPGRILIPVLHITKVSHKEINVFWYLVVLFSMIL